MMIRILFVLTVLSAACSPETPVCAAEGAWVPLEEGGWVKCGRVNQFAPANDPDAEGQVCRTYYKLPEGKTPDVDPLSGPNLSCPPIWECAVCLGDKVYSESFEEHLARINKGE